MIRIRPFFADRISGFLSYYFQSTVCRSFFLAITKQVTISGIDSQQLKDILVPFPPLAEALEIWEACQSSDNALDEVSHSITRSIRGLDEYRSALITAAVTGKLRLDGEPIESAMGVA